MLQIQRAPSEGELKVDKVYRRLLEKYIHTYDSTSWTLTIGAFAVAGYLMANTEKLAPYLGEANMVVTAIAIVAIGVVGLVVKAINNKIVIFLEFSAPTNESYGVDEKLAVKWFERARSPLLTRSKGISERLREAVGGANLSEGDLAAHVYWQPILLLVKVSHVLRGFRYLMIAVSIWSFTSGFVEATRGHDLTVAALKAEVTVRAEHLTKMSDALKNEATNLEYRYQQAQAANNSLTDKYKALAANNADQVALLQGMLTVERNREKNMEETLLTILSSLREHATTPEAKAKMDALIEQVRSAYEPNDKPDPAARRESH